MSAIPTIKSIYRLLANCKFPLVGDHQTKYGTLSCLDYFKDPYSSFYRVNKFFDDFEMLLYVKHVLFLKDGLTEYQIDDLKRELTKKFGYSAAIVHYVKIYGEQFRPMIWINNVYDYNPFLTVYEEDHFLYQTPYVEIVFKVGSIPTLMSFREIIKNYLSFRDAPMKTKYFFSSDQKFAYNPIIHTKSQDGPEFVDGVTFKAYIPEMIADKESLENIVKIRSFDWKNISLSVGILCEEGYKMYEIDSKNKEWNEYVSNPQVSRKESFLELTFRA